MQTERRRQIGIELNLNFSTGVCAGRYEYALDNLKGFQQSVFEVVVAGLELVTVLEFPMHIVVAETGFEETVKVVEIAEPHVRSGFEQGRFGASTKATQQEKLAVREVVTPKEAHFRIERFSDFCEVQTR